MYHASPHLTYLLQTDLLKPDVSKLNYPLYPPWDWAEKSFRCYSHSANPLLTGVPAEGFGLLIVSARLQMFQPVKVRCYEISKTLKTVSRPIIIRGRTRKKTLSRHKKKQELGENAWSFSRNSRWQVGKCRSCRQVKR